MIPIRRRALPYMLALALVSVAYISYGSSSHTTEAKASTRQLHFRVPARGTTSGLSAGEQVKAVNAFSKMVPVFRHARCFNCHGAFDITNSDEHTGAAAVPKDLDFRQSLDVPQRQRLHAQCGECHNQITGHANRPTLAGNVIVAGWMIAPQPMQWVTAADDEELCVLVKGHEENADSFISHVRIDHGEIQFLKAAFEGKRALDSANMDLYDVVAEPPPGSMASLIAQGTQWAQLVGDHWTDSRECGCVMPKIKLKVHHTWLMDTPGGIPSKQSSDVQFEVDLEPYSEDRPNFFQGHFSLDRKVDMTLPSFCTANAAVKERWQFNATLDEETGEVKLWHHQIPGAQTGQMVCRQGGGVARMDVDPGTLAGIIGSGEMVIPPSDSIGRKQTSVQGLRETLAITVRSKPTN